MTPELLQQLGLTASQAKTYLTLIEKGELAPPALARLTGETRSNTYMILQKLEELGLVEKMNQAKKISYQPTSPVALESLAEKHRRDSVTVEQQVKHSMPQMLSYFYAFTEKPGIRLLQGLEGLKEIYTDTLRTKQDVYFMRTPKEVEFLGDDFFERYKTRRAKLGITTHAFTPGPPSAQKSAGDKAYKMIRTWMNPRDYDAPVEVNVYGDKVGFLVYGEEIMGVIVQNKHIAESMRQIFTMLKKVNH